MTTPSSSPPQRYSPFHDTAWLRRALVLTAILAALSSPGAPIELELRSGGDATVPPGGFHVVTILVRPEGAATLLDERIHLPDTWSALEGGAGRFSSAAGGTVRFIGIRVPRDAPAGEYRVDYAVAAAGDDTAPPAHLALHVRVPAVTRLDVVAEGASDRVIAGATIVHRYRLTNRGNHPAEIDLHARSSLGLPLEAPPAMLALAPGESHLITVAVDTSRAARKRQNHLTELRAVLRSGNVIDRRTLAHTTEIIPIATDPTPALGTIPAYSAVRFEQRRAGDASRSRLLAETGARGFLDAAQRHALEFQVQETVMQRPDQDADGLMRLAYRGPHLGISVGDDVHALSNLTQPRLFGRGVGADLRLGSTRLGAFHIEPPASHAFTQVRTGAWIEGRPTPAWRLRTQFLERTTRGASIEGVDRARLASIETGLERPPHIVTRLEVARSDGTSLPGALAWRAATRLRSRHGLDLDLEHLHAGAEFAGPYRDLTLDRAALLWKPRPWLRWRLSTHRLETNTAGTPDRPERFSRAFSAGAELALSRRLSLQATAGISRQAQRQLPAAFDRETESIGLAAAWNGGRLDAQVAAEVGRQARTEVGRDFARGSLALGLRPLPPVRLSAFFSTGDPLFVAASLGRQTYARASAEVQATRSLALMADVATQLDSGPRTRRRSLWSAGVLWQDERGRQASLHIEHTLHYYPRASASQRLVASVRLPFGLPAPVRRPAASAAGQLRLDGTENEAPIAGAIIAIAGRKVATGPDGRFVFPRLTPGRHRLEVDLATLGFDHVMAADSPTHVLVHAGQREHLDLVAMRGAEIAGEVVRYAIDGADVLAAPRGGAVHFPAQAGGGPRYHPTAGMPGIVVRLEGDTGVHYAITDARGQFIFDRLVPGRWILIFDESGLPAHHRMDGTRHEIVVAPGQRIEVHTRVLPVMRPVRTLARGADTAP